MDIYLPVIVQELFPKQVDEFCEGSRIGLFVCINDDQVHDLFVRETSSDEHHFTFFGLTLLRIYRGMDVRVVLEIPQHLGR